MKLLYVLLFFIVANVCCDDKCGGDLNRLWLDVVIVADNSQGVNKTDSQRETFLSQIRHSISYIFQNVSIPRTRVGFVTYNSQATIIADLNKFQSYDELMQGVNASYNEMNLSPENTSFIATGLTSAAELLQVQGSADGRVNNPKVIILYASVLNGTGLLDPLLVANTLKSAGITIITIAVEIDYHNILKNQLAPIATPGGYAFSLRGYGRGHIALINANCFCPPGWTQYQKIYYHEENSDKYATCFQFIGAPTSWNTARLGCRNLWPGNSYLVMENDSIKQNFIRDSVTNNTAFQQTPLQFHIGLNLFRGKWVWDQPYGQPQQELDWEWSRWLDQYPVVSSTMTAVMTKNVTTRYETVLGWENIDPMKVSAGYVCEAVACSVNNFCDANWNTHN